MKRHQLARACFRALSPDQRYTIIVLLTILLTLLFLPALEASPQQTRDTLSNTQEKLKRLKEDISDLARRITIKKRSYESLQIELKRVEKNISDLAKTILINEVKITKQEEKIHVIKSKVSQIQNNQRRLKRQLTEDVRLTQKQSRYGQLHLFLNSKDPSSLSRNLYLQKQIQQARANQYKELSTHLNLLEQNQNQLQQETSLLTAFQTELSTKKTELSRKKNQRHATLVQLSKEVQSQQTKLKKKEQHATELEQLITRLNEQLKTTTLDGSTFAKQKGRLEWPAKGQIVRHFNEKRPGSGQLLWKGIVIKSQEGQAVNAVFSGTIVYADWMTGFGNLLILDHGGGYLSLYGNNQTLLKGAGDTVVKGEQIATVGNSGGAPENALYFEIRRKNKALNPANWCKKN